MSLKFVDTFAGVGGFHIGIKNVLPDAECALAVEWDKDAENCHWLYLDREGSKASVPTLRYNALQYGVASLRTDQDASFG